MKKYFLTAVCLLTIFTLIFGSASGEITEPITKTVHINMHVPRDFRNYFILQSINDQTTIIIGDFVGSDKLISLIRDTDGDMKEDRVYEWYPDLNKYRVIRRVSTSLFEGFEETSKQIISGKIFRENYAYKMNSINFLIDRLKQGTDMFKTQNGYSVKIYDEDEESKIKGEYFFQRKNGKYDLQFKTYYYKLYGRKIVPSYTYSVYCSNSTNPVVKDTVERLIKIIE